MDERAITEARRQIVARKRYLRMIYQEWYERIIDKLPACDGRVLEIGAGAGFFRSIFPEAIASEVFLCGGIHAVLDARSLPFSAASLRAIVMTDVLHHIPDVERFLEEACRVLKSGGRILMIEPWVTTWSTFIYGTLHPEPFRPDAREWQFESTGPLTDANGALPWIVFHRDAQRFKQQYPELEVALIDPFMPFRYLLSGGVSMRALVPTWTFGWTKSLETALRRQMDRLAMFAFIQVNRR